MTRKNPGHELRHLNDMKSLRLCGYQEHLKVVVDINDFGLLSQGFRCNEQLRIVEDIRYSRS